MEQITAWESQVQPYAQMVTPFEFTYLNSLVTTVAEQAGLESDQVRYVICLFAAYPLAIVYSHLPTASLKHVFDIVIGIALAQFVLGTGWIHSFAASFVTYLLVRFGPSKYAPYIVFLFNMVRIY